MADFIWAVLFELSKPQRRNLTPTYIVIPVTASDDYMVACFKVQSVKSLIIVAIMSFREIMLGPDPIQYSLCAKEYNADR